MHGRSPGPVVLTIAWVGAFGWALVIAWLLGRGLAPASLPSVPAVDVLSVESLAEARDFRGSLRTIGLLAQAVTILVLLGVALSRRLPTAGQLSRLSSRPLIGGVFLGVTVSLLLFLVRLPFDFAVWRIGIDFDLLTLGFGTWALDSLKRLVIGLLLSGLAGGAATWAWLRFGRLFWVVASLALATFAAIWLWIWPVVVSPLFNRVVPLPEGPARASLERIAAESGIEVEGVFTEDASRRTRALNAYVHGLGPSRRVVIQDTALERLDPGETEVLVAHELAHVEYRDPERGLLFALLVIPPAALAVQLLAIAILRRRGQGSSGPLAVLPLALGFTLASLLISIPGSWLSRQVEARADQRALELTLDPGAAASLHREVAKTNLQDPSPPAVWTGLFGTHPPAVERVGLARKFEAERGPGGDGG